MNSCLEKTSSFYPVLVVGGGIVGASIFRELCLHKIPCLLIDKKDFSSQTSQSSSKMLHGGLRYLKNFDFKLIRQALKEKKHWLKTVPHLCYRESFHIPVYKKDPWPLWTIKLGLNIYDALSGYQNDPHYSLSSKDILKSFPLLKKEGLKGACVYEDGIIDDAKFTLEILFDGLLFSESEALNYVSLEELKKNKDLWELHLKDQLTGKHKQIKAQHIIFATGPFSDQLFKKLNAFPWEPKLSLSKGSHLWLKKEALPIAHPLVLTPPDGRLLFVIPRSQCLLVGTTEIPLHRAPFNLKPSIQEIQYLLKNLKAYFPQSRIDSENILGSFAGIRPLIKDPSKTYRGKISRVHKIYQPGENLHVVLGGKYTTCRVMASQVVAPLIVKLKTKYNPQLSLQPLRVQSSVLPFQPWKPNQEDINKIVATERPRTYEDLVERRLGLLNPDLKGLKFPFLKKEGP